MLYESPSSSTDAHTFHNKTKFRFHDWPPPSKTGGKSVVGPCRYGMMNGDSFPFFLKDGAPPDGLMEHWAKVVPNFKAPTFVDKITDNDTAYAYLPVEQIRNHVNDPDIHYHLAGKDAIHMMTQKVCRPLDILVGGYLSLACTKATHTASSLSIHSDDGTARGYAYRSPLCRQNDSFHGFQGNLHHQQ
jgi:hypothetical protein